MRTELRATQELRRINAIPRRIVTHDDAVLWAHVLTRDLAVPGSGANLLPWQGMGIAETLENDGAFLGLPVGHGKTLLTYTIPRLMGAKRPIIVMAKALREKTLDDFASYRGLWHAPNPIPSIVTKEALYQPGNEEILFRLNPDLVMLEEADDYANYASSMVAKLDRYKRETNVPYVALTGSPIRKSLMGVWHLFQWTVGDNNPLPNMYEEARMWDKALSEGGCRTGEFRPRPGALGSTLAKAREWLARRIRETPGILLVDEDSCKQPIKVYTFPAIEDPELDKHYKVFGKTRATPGGEIVSDPLSRWSFDGYLGCGFYRYWDPPPPEEWREAYRAKSKFVRTMIARLRYTSRPIDTESGILRRYARCAAVQRWNAVKASFNGKTKTAWITDSALRSAEQWLLERSTDTSLKPKPGRASIVWCGSIPYAEELARRTGLPYYGEEGKTKSGAMLHRAKPTTHLICSWMSNKKGFNLQDWAECLVVHPPQSAKWLEQLLGRSHRTGQKKPVNAWIMLTSGGTIDAFETAINEAAFARDSMTLRQKILRARIKRGYPEITKSNKYRWASRSAQESSINGEE